MKLRPVLPSIRRAMPPHEQDSFRTRPPSAQTTAEQRASERNATVGIRNHNRVTHAVQNDMQPLAMFLQLLQGAFGQSGDSKAKP